MSCCEGSARSRWRQFFHEHGLSLFFLGLLTAQTTGWALAKQAGGWWAQWVGEWLLSVLAESMGMLILVLATKKLVERGSVESRE